jgi:hypothetical protein
MRCSLLLPLGVVNLPYWADPRGGLTMGFYSSIWNKDPFRRKMADGVGRSTFDLSVPVPYEEIWLQENTGICTTIRQSIRRG